VLIRQKLAIIIIITIIVMVMAVGIIAIIITAGKLMPDCVGVDCIDPRYENTGGCNPPLRTDDIGSAQQFD
jgi:hypothetical protein